MDKYIFFNIDIFLTNYKQLLPTSTYHTTKRLFLQKTKQTKQTKNNNKTTKQNKNKTKETCIYST